VDAKQNEEENEKKGPSDFSMACRRFHTLSGAVPLFDDTHTSGAASGSSPGGGPART